MYFIQHHTNDNNSKHIRLDIATDIHTNTHMKSRIHVSEQQKYHTECRRNSSATRTVERQQFESGSCHINNDGNTKQMLESKQYKPDTRARRNQR